MWPIWCSVQGWSGEQDRLGTSKYSDLNPTPGRSLLLTKREGECWLLPNVCIFKMKTLQNDHTYKSSIPKSRGSQHRDDKIYSSLSASTYSMWPRYTLLTFSFLFTFICLQGLPGNSLRGFLAEVDSFFPPPGNYLCFSLCHTLLCSFSHSGSPCCQLPTILADHHLALLSRLWTLSVHGPPWFPRVHSKSADSPTCPQVYRWFIGGLSEDNSVPDFEFLAPGLDLPGA